MSIQNDRSGLAVMFGYAEAAIMVAIIFIWQSSAKVNEWRKPRA